MINSLSTAIKRIANGHLVILSLILYAIFPLYILKNAEHEMISIAGTSPVLDLKFYYSPDEAWKSLQLLGPDGREKYALLEKISDPLYMIAYSSFYSLLIAFCLKRIKRSYKLNVLIILPFLVALLDLAENICILKMIEAFPDRSDPFAWTGAAFTLLKWVLALPVFGFASLMILKVGRKAFLPRRGLLVNRTTANIRKKLSYRPYMKRSRRRAFIKKASVNS